MRFFPTIIARAFGVVILTAPLLSADTAPSQAARDAQVVFLGEQHDNPAHHETQARWTADLAPTALVFEMITDAQAARVTPDNRRYEIALESALQWHASGWPDFSMYFPIFEAAPDAVVYGAAVPRSQLGNIMQSDLVEVADPEVTRRFALDRQLPEAELAARVELKRVSHCDALPVEMLPRMVNVQRLRDAVIADAARQALVETGGPVVVITGNGHAREDWGAPFLLRQAEPEITVFTLGQGEAGSIPDGGFGIIADGPTVDRGDPCDAFN